MQTVQTQIRLLLKEQFDQSLRGLHSTKYFEYIKINIESIK